MEHRQSNELRHRVPRNPISCIRNDELPLADLAVDFIPDAVLSHRLIFVRFTCRTEAGTMLGQVLPLE